MLTASWAVYLLALLIKLESSMAYVTKTRLTHRKLSTLQDTLDATQAQDEAQETSSFDFKAPGEWNLHRFDFISSCIYEVHEIERRRNFAIISHPDAGKTTLTEKLLLFGGAIQDAGAVKVTSSHNSIYVHVCHSHRHVRTKGRQRVIGWRLKNSEESR